MDEDVIGIFAFLALGTFALVVFAISILVWCRIVGRTGLSAWLGLLMFVPIANLVMFLVLAFGRWPIEDELQRLRTQAAGG